MSSLISFFSKNRTDGNINQPELLGAKGAHLAEMSRLGLPVPPGFTIHTSACLDYLRNRTIVPELKDTVRQALAELGEPIGRRFGDTGPEHKTRPLLISVRSSSRAPIPGIVSAVLNLGMNLRTVDQLIEETGNPRFAWDTYRRFIEMYATVVDHLERHEFEDILTQTKKVKGCADDTSLEAQDLERLCARFLDYYQSATGQAFPEDPYFQLWSAIAAVFRSWDSPRSRKYREIHQIPDHWGAAVNICSMVYGNLGQDSGAGICVTRNPSTGENALFGEFLIDAQGEDVVAGIRAPRPLAELKTLLPQVYAQLEDVRTKLERQYKDAQDIEFTIERGRLYLLQTQDAKRTTTASITIATSFAEEGILSKEEALLRINAHELERVLHPSLDPRAHRQLLTRGLPASPGAVAGRIVFFAEDAEIWNMRGEEVILVREETSPEDIGGMHAAKGFLTARGGMTSHAAVVARQIGKTCVVGCAGLRISALNKTLQIGDHLLLEGDWLTLEGSTGEVLLGRVATSQAALSKELHTLLGWAQDIQKMKVRANADTPTDATTARIYGAQGIGLCRTEHMFFNEGRLPLVRQMILAANPEERMAALEKLLPVQQADFEQLLTTMSGYPVTIRLLDPPLHEFLPHPKENLHDLALRLGTSEGALHDRILQLTEENPLLGHRGCRLGISHPEIYEMQVKAIFRATASARQKGFDPQPEIMIPLVGLSQEINWLRTRLEGLLETELSDLNSSTRKIAFGTMIEVPRAALTADQLAQHADFFSFGTNDLTQTTFGFSRDDSGVFLRAYEKEGILNFDPFSQLDRDGVGKLLEMAVILGRKTKPKLRIGICGEQAGDPDSIQHLQTLGIDYLSCSPFRVPIAQIASAQAEIRSRRDA